MKKNMEYFWDNDLAPELVDSRIARGYRTYRHPLSRQAAYDQKLKKSKAKNENENGTLNPKKSGN